MGTIQRINRLSAFVRPLLFAMLIPGVLYVSTSTAFASTPENPVFRVSPSGWDSTSVREPEVKFFGCLHMWYQGYQADVTFSQIGFARSCDGINWTKSVENPVIVQDQPWKSSSIGGMSVIFDAAQGFSPFKMWYEGRSADGDWSIGYATSPDGVHWADHPDNPIIVHGPDTSFTRSIRSPTVLRVIPFGPFGPFGVDPEPLKMWFWGSNLDFGGTSAGIGLATSADGISWTLPNAPLPSLSGPEFRDPDVLRLRDQRGLNYRSFCRDPIFNSNRQIGANPCDFYPFMDNDPSRPEIPLVGEAIVHDMNALRRIIVMTLNPFRMFYVKGTDIYQATSLDAQEWTAHQLIVAPDPLEFWKSDNVSGPGAVLINGELQLYFAGSPTGFDSNIGLETSLMTLAVDIDIRPGSDLNPVNPLSAGVIPVVILGSDVFEVANVNVTTLGFGANGATPTHDGGGHFEDVNADGLIDLISHYRTEETGIVSDNAMACVRGETTDGMPFEGCDGIHAIPQHEDNLQAISQPEVDIIESLPSILDATLTLNETEVVCDMTDPFRFIVQRDFCSVNCDDGSFSPCFMIGDACGVGMAGTCVVEDCLVDLDQVAADLEDLEIGMAYTELAFDVDVTDPDSDPNLPGESDILGVTATYVTPARRTEDSLVLFDDGSANKMSYTQLGFTNLVCDESTGTLSCERIDDFILTSSDQIADDSRYTRRIATFDLDLELTSSELLAQDCAAQENGLVFLRVEGGESLDFRIDVVDRAGNIATWPTPLPATAQKSSFICRGDDCLCCLLENRVFTNCSQLPGIAGLCSFI